ncbi:MAG: metalloregulator ArsR/SmtB family transcription factor [Myxococcota bacterium]
MVQPDPRLFAALADSTRLALIDELARQSPQPTTALARDAGASRQAVTKHLAVLAEAGLVRDERRGRERLWSLQAAPLRDVRDWADRFRRHWSARLDRLERFLADHPEGDEP